MLHKSYFALVPGWLFKLELKNPEELKQLMDEKAYEAFLKSQSTEEH
jgi:glycine cleavage system H lipoate-binding protein